MYSGAKTSFLTTSDEREIALQFINIEAIMENNLCKTSVHQIYKNYEEKNIEAVYTFPLPMNAVLLSLSIQTNDKKLEGVIVKKEEAEESYEDAVIDGDTAIMLEQVGSGLFTMNVGNLLSGDKIEIIFTYVELFQWRDDTLRFFLPTTIAPKYGSFNNIPLEPHQIPEHDLMVENTFTFTLKLFGDLSNTKIDSPTHLIKSKKFDRGSIITLQNETALMDRDLIINLNSSTMHKSYATFIKHKNEYIGIASFYPEFKQRMKNKPKIINILIDCSGSMNGDSIQQAKEALKQILNLIKNHDYFNIICFGSTYEKLFSKPLIANKNNLEEAKNLLSSLDADMGGTEIASAINELNAHKNSDKIQEEVLLITDGEIWETKEVISIAKKTTNRFFIIGVGSAVSESFLKELSYVTGGICELVTPKENMAVKITSHFKKIFSKDIKTPSIDWALNPTTTIKPKFHNVFNQDTFNVFAKFKKKPEGTIVLSGDINNEEKYVLKVNSDQNSFTNIFDSHEILPRLAAFYEVKSISDSNKIAEIAVGHQLMSSETNFIAIDIKDKKASQLPSLRKTPQMLAAGWGGVGSVNEHIMRGHLRTSTSEELANWNELDNPTFKRNKFDGNSLEPPTFLRRQNNSYNRIKQGALAEHDLIEFINNFESIYLSDNWLEDLNLYPESDFYSFIEKVINKFSNEHLSEQYILILLSYVLLFSKEYKNEFSKELKRIVIKEYRQIHDLSSEVMGKVKFELRESLSLTDFRVSNTLESFRR